MEKSQRQLEGSRKYINACVCVLVLHEGPYMAFKRIFERRAVNAVGNAVDKR